jgi:hypothetical protein
MDAWEPERPSASKSAFARGFACRHVQDSENPRAFPGGTPEPEDGGDLVATLVREAFEGKHSALSRCVISYSAA